jgi:hypothetical protein
MLPPSRSVTCSPDGLKRAFPDDLERAEKNVSWRRVNGASALSDRHDRDMSSVSGTGWAAHRTKRFGRGNCGHAWGATRTHG